ncbi:hypothetical protein F2Q69_00028949 [Brassica cretica]|uniref:Uncharacterized protein n=2 Tax=Brassica TaxID=3705 RepID=A0A8S9RRS5_BRACR|nr:hypothetical protein F2Q69_00028949 [Brassica cretica]
MCFYANPNLSSLSRNDGIKKEAETYKNNSRTTAPPVPNRQSPPGVSDYPPPRQLFQDSQVQTQAASATLHQPSPPQQPRRSETSPTQNSPSSSQAQDSATTERPEAVDPTLSDEQLRVVNELLSQPNRGLDIPILSPTFEPATTWFRIDDCIRNDVVGVAQALTELNLLSWSVTKFHLTCETASAPSNQQLTVAYIEIVTNVDAEPKESPAASLCRNVGVDGRLTTVQSVVTG